MRKHLLSLGIVPEYPANVDLLMDEKGDLFTKFGEPIKGSISPFADVVHNKKYKMGNDGGDKNGNWVLYQSIKGGAGGKQYLYTQDYHVDSKQARFKVVDEVIVGMENIKKKWRSKLIAANEDGTDFEEAMVAEIAYQTSFRIGSKLGMSRVNGKNITTYGICVLQMRHFRFSGRRCQIKFVGKSGKINKAIIEGTDPRLRLILKVLKQRKAEWEPATSMFGVNSTQVNKYLRSIGLPAKASVHKFRHAEATQIAREILKTSPFKREDEPKQSEVNNWLKQKLEAAGKALGHLRTDASGNQVSTSATALASYIDPGLLVNFYEDLNLRPLESLIKQVKK